MCWDFPCMLKSSRGMAVVSYLCLGTTSLLVLETFKFKNFETWLPATIMDVYSNISLSSFLYWYATLNSSKYLKSETHLRNAQVNRASSANKEIVKICLIVDMVRKYWSLWVALLHFGWFWLILSLCEF